MRDDDDLRVAYRPRLREPGSHRLDCPGPDAILAASRGEGPETERLEILDRALRCPVCRRELALLHAVSGTGTRVSAAPGRIGVWRRFGPLALAASVLLAVSFFGLDQWRNRFGDQTTRGTDQREVSLLAPTEGAAVASGAIRFVWTSVPGAFRYTVEVDDAGGTVLFSATTPDTALTATLDSLTRGDHGWFVRGQLDDGTERRSRIRTLRLR